MNLTTYHTIEELDEDYEGVEGELLVHWRAGGEYRSAYINGPAECCYEAEAPEYEIEGVVMYAFGKAYHLHLEEVLEYLPYEELLGAAQLEYER